MFLLLKSVLGSSDFWIMCFLNLMLTVLVNGIVDYFTIMNTWKTAPKIFNAAKVDTVFTFFLINALIIGANRQRQINLIKEGALEAIPTSAFRNILAKIFFFGSCSTKPLLRAVLITINALMYIAPTYFLVKDSMVSAGIWNKYTIFSGVQSYGPCISCAVFTEMIWKSYIFVVMYFLTYAGSLNADQPEISGESSNHSKKVE